MADDSHFWDPFTSSDEFTPAWWQPAIIMEDDIFLEVCRADKEVARVHLDEQVSIDHYTDTPDLGNVALEIQFIEVAASCRRQGIGRQVVELLMSRYSDRRLVAFSEEADDFWESLGWERHEHPEGNLHYRPLYIQPAGQPG